MPYYTYILRCADDSLYTGITTDLAARFSQHAGKGKNGAKYTASRRPLCYEAAWESADRASASRLEYRIKKLRRREKLELIATGSCEKLELAGYTRVPAQAVSALFEEKGEGAVDKKQSHDGVN